MANEFSVSKRTILRDLQELKQAGFPLYSEVGAAGGYHILKERILPPIAFIRPKKFLNCLPLNVQNSITQIQNKGVFWIPDRHCNSPLLKSMFLVVLNRHAATIRYSSTYFESTRTIIPIGLYAMNGLWYCPAYCTTANQIRVFRVDRIKEIIEEKPYPKGKYSIPTSIQEYLEKTGVKNDYHMKIQLTDTGVKRCESKCLLASGLKTFPTGGGIIDMEINHAVLEWVADYILPFGNNATVLEPLELIKLMQHKIYELHQHYCSLETSMNERDSVVGIVYLSYGIVGNSVCRTWESCTVAFPCPANRVIYDSIACCAHIHNARLWIFDSELRPYILVILFKNFNLFRAFNVIQL